MKSISLENLCKSERYKSIEQLPEWLCSQEVYSEQIRALRKLLGMTQGQLARRAGKDPRLICNLEGGKNDPQLSTLLKAAEGLACELVIRFVPKEPIAKMLKERAQNKASQMVQLSQGSSAMEEQEPKKIFVQLQITELVNDLLKKPSLLWED